MAIYQVLKCEKCKHYEAFHQYPNPNAVARHYCKKCRDEIRYVREHPLYDRYIVWLPKGCYFNVYFEESEEAKKERERRYVSEWTFYQVED